MDAEASDGVGADSKPLRGLARMALVACPKCVSTRRSGSAGVANLPLCLFKRRVVSRKGACFLEESGELSASAQQGASWGRRRSGDGEQGLEFERVVDCSGDYGSAGGAALPIGLRVRTAVKRADCKTRIATLGAWLSRSIAGQVRYPSRRRSLRHSPAAGRC